MLNHPTFDQLRTLKFDGMADAFAELQAQDQAKASVLSGSPRHMERSASKRPAARLSTSVPAPTPRSTRSSRTTLIAGNGKGLRTARRLSTPTSAAQNTSTKETTDA